VLADRCGECGAGETRFEGIDFSVEHAGKTVEVGNLSGWRCGACGEVRFDPESAARYAEAGDRLVLEARQVQALELRNIRRRLGLSQKRAATLTGGGHNAFSRYERGEAVPVAAVVNLFRLLNRHPELLREIDVVPASSDEVETRATIATGLAHPSRLMPLARND
jgi:HTH-type transcriptional regulator/antitoxin MqsA